MKQISLKVSRDIPRQTREKVYLEHPWKEPEITINKLDRRGLTSLEVRMLGWHLHSLLKMQL
jgi:hypothetical protein